MKQAGSTALWKSGWMILAVIILIALFLSTNWYYYNRTRRSLEDEFSFRLRALASIVASSIDPAGFIEMAPDEIPISLQDTLLSSLLEISSSYSLSNILIVREDGIILASLQPGIYPPGEEYPNWTMDYPAIINALEGRPAATKLYKAPDGTFLKAGYAPVPPEATTPTAFVAVEASVEFLEGLHELRNILVAATALSIIGAALFAWFVFKATGSLIQARESHSHAETLSSMGRMAAGIAHEIRNPLFIIRSSAENMKKAHPDESEMIDNFIIEEVDRLNGILTDYLLFSRNEPAPKHAMDILATLRRSARLVRETIEEPGLEIKEQFSVDEAPFHGEEKRLQQSFLNILLNARQSMKDSGTIDICFESRGGEYIISFRDSGSGIAARDLEKVFEPFYTTKPTGSGLGLAIVKKVIEDHDGSVEITSGEGEGTKLVIVLPAATR